MSRELPELVKETLGIDISKSECEFVCDNLVSLGIVINYLPGTQRGFCITELGKVFMEECTQTKVTWKIHNN